MANSMLSASAKGATFLILLQVGSRALTFAVNQVLLRFLSPELLGISAQLELFSISVIYFARESVRVALQRQTRSAQTVVNLSYLSVVLGVVFKVVLERLYLRHGGVPDVPHFARALQLYGLGTLLELLAEPGFAVAQQRLLYKVRASAETAATIARCLGTCGPAIWASRAGVNLGALPFAIGQLSYALVLLVVYVTRLWPLAREEKFSLLPRRLPPNANDPYVLQLFSRSLSFLALSLFVQSSIKYVLTQGDSLLIASLTSLHDQGAYALASNYGGLIARMLFQPIEESSRNLFAKLCAPDSQKEGQKDANTNKETDPTSNTEGKRLNQASGLLLTLLKSYTVFSLPIVLFGPHLASPALSLIAGRRWSASGAAEVLATYCYYIPLLALNGVTEAFVAAVADNQQLRNQSLCMSVFFGAFAGAAWLFLGVWEMGAQGVVYANCVNMALRIVWNSWFITSYFVRRGVAFDWRKAAPNMISIAGSVPIKVLLDVVADKSSGAGVFKQLLQFGAVGIAYAVMLLSFEHEFVLSCIKLFRSGELKGEKVKSKEEDKKSR